MMENEPLLNPINLARESVLEQLSVPAQAKLDAVKSDDPSFYTQLAVDLFKNHQPFNEIYP